jgi:hypothetical protein
MKFSYKYNYKRAQCKDPNIIQGWFRLIRNIIAKWRILDIDIYNFNKVGFLIGVTTTTKVAISIELRN